MKQYFKYLKSVVRHKKFVYQACRQLGVSWLSSVLHDWDKFLPDEFISYANTFYKPNGESQYVESIDFAKAWMKHMHRNKHHWQYWLVLPVTKISIRKVNIMVWDRGIVEQILGDRRQILPNDVVTPLPMPHNARLEMIADWFGAGKAYNPDWTPLEPTRWYEKNKDKIILHPDTRLYVENKLWIEEERYLDSIKE